jgi:predicted dehydrogenase
MNKVTYAVIGGGFRAEFFLRLAKEIPGHFEVAGIATSHPERTAALCDSLGIKAYRNAEELLEKTRDKKTAFLVVSTARPAANGREPMENLLPLGLPILMETPAAGNYDDLIGMYELCRGKRVQVAEQVHAQPENAARIRIARSGLLGEVTQAELSLQHTYHCMNVMRRFLGIGFENAEIRAKRFAYPVVQGYTRSGVSETETIVNEKRVFALLDFGGKLGVYNYEDNQVRSYVRSEHVSIRGERGEINDRTVRYLATHQDFRCYTYERMYSGAQNSLEGFFFRGLLGHNEWLFKNPYPHAPLADDDIAIAAMLDQMASYAEGGPSFSSIEEACQDAYLGLLIEKSALSGKYEVSETQPWARAGAYQ